MEQAKLINLKRLKQSAVAQTGDGTTLTDAMEILSRHTNAWMGHCRSEDKQATDKVERVVIKAIEAATNSSKPRRRKRETKSSSMFRKRYEYLPRLSRRTLR